MPFRGKLEYHGYQLSSVQFNPVQSLGHAWFFGTPWNYSTSDFPVHHHLLGLAQAHVQRVGDAIQTSHLLSFPFLWLQSSPASGSFPLSQFFTSSGQIIGTSASVLPMNIQDWLSLLLTGWISLQSKGLSKSLLQHHSSIIWHSAFFMVQLPPHTWMTTGKTIALTARTLAGKVMSLFFNMLSRLVIAFLPRSKCLLISWLQSPSAMTWRPKTKVSYCFHCFPVFCHEVMGPDAMTLVFWMLSFKPTLSLSSFTFIKRLFSSSSLSAIRVVSSAYLKLLMFLLEILSPGCASSSPAFLMM